jgi:hypothetical protein
MHTNNTPNLERPMLRMGSVAFLAGIVIFMVSTVLLLPWTGSSKAEEKQTLVIFRS